MVGIQISIEPQMTDQLIRRLSYCFSVDRFDPSERNITDIRRTNTKQHAKKNRGCNWFLRQKCEIDRDT